MSRMVKIKRTDCVDKGVEQMKLNSLGYYMLGNISSSNVLVISTTVRENHFSSSTKAKHT
jgi:hypothetical protein